MKYEHCNAEGLCFMEGERRWCHCDCYDCKVANNTDFGKAWIRHGASSKTKKGNRR